MPEYPQSIAHGSGATLTLIPNLAVASVSPSAAADARGILRSVGLVAVADSADRGTRGRASARINDSDERRWVRIEQSRGLRSVGPDVQAQLGDRLGWLAPAYRFPGVEGDEGVVCLLPDVLLVRFSDGAADDDVAARTRDLGLEEDGKRSHYTQPFRYFRIANPMEKNAYEMRDELLAEDQLVEDVRFETMPMIVPSTAAANDPLYPDQWGVQMIEASGAWDVTTGTSSVVICVLDEGCDLSHPDLFFSDSGINLGTLLPDGSPTGNHGTACAGIAAAQINNGLGIAGVAGSCSILPAAFQNWTDVECAAGIRYAADNGADVLSMSFGVYAAGEDQGPAGWDFAIIDPAIVYAHAAGVVLCAATGNEDIATSNRYPSRHPLVIACGASDQVDNRKSSTSPDGEDWWGSNFAPGVSVVAPGVLIPTTDRQGTAGYNPTSGVAGDYTPDFNGTSSATPHIAGLAALIKSHRPSLSNDEIRTVIERTADKVGTVPYSEEAGFPNGSRNDEMGYGRVNARRALVEGLAPDQQVEHRADLTGDGRADIVGFGTAGVWVSLNNGDGSFQGPQMVVANFAYEAGGWRVEKHPRFLADVTGDGRADIVGFGTAGVWVSLNNGDGTFQGPQMVVANFAYEAGGWRVEKHPRYLADLTGNGCADIVGFGTAGVWVSLNNGDGTFQAPQMVVANFAYEGGGWRVEKHPRFLADVTGDGRADIVGFGTAGVWVSLNNGDGTFQAPQMVVANFAYEGGGWRVEKHPRFLADLTADGRADIVGFGTAGVWVSLNNGDGSFQAPQMVVANFAYEAGGWRVEKHPRFLADLTGDGCADIVGFGTAGVWVSLNNGDGTFQGPQMVVANFAYEAGGWRVEKHPRFLADVTGDHRKDIVGFGTAGVWESLNNGDATFQALQMVVANFAYEAGGWRVEKHPRMLVGSR